MLSLARGEADRVKRRQSFVRTATAALAAVFAVGAAARLVYVLGSSELTWGTSPGAYLVPAAVSIGGFLYVAATWSSRCSALHARRIGWGLMAAALLVPSTFSLALPLVAPLVLTLRHPDLAAKAHESMPSK